MLLLKFYLDPSFSSLIRVTGKSQTATELQSGKGPGRSRRPSLPIEHPSLEQHLTDLKPFVNSALYF